MAKCIERESVANYQLSLRLINSSACFFETLNFSHTAKHPFLVMAPMQSLFSTAHFPFPRHPFQESDEKASYSASSSIEERRKREELRQRHVKSRAIHYAGVDNAMPTDPKWNQFLEESNSVSVDASVRIHDNGQSNFWGQMYSVYSILTKSLCFP